MVPFTVEQGLVRPRRLSSGLVPPFEIRAVDPALDPETFATIWPEYADADEETIASRAAFRTLRAGDGVHVLYNTSFGPYRTQLQALAAKSSRLAASFRRAYEIWIAYHGIVAETQVDDTITSLSDETRDLFLASERVRIATVQAKQSALIADLEQRAVRVLTSSDAA